MRETENFNLSINNNNHKKSNFLDKNICYDDIVEFIKSKKLASVIEEKLLKIAKKTPHGSLLNFKNNYKRYMK